MDDLGQNPVVSSASDPPLSSTALLDFRHRVEIWTSASGRDSKMTPMTPIGLDTRYKSSPGSSSVVRRVWPTGSGRSIRLLIPATTSWILFRSNFNRLSKGAASPSWVLRSRSVWFAAKRAGVFSSKAAAMLFRAFSLVYASKAIIWREAFLAWIAIS